jgi:hypothetical protein
MKKLFLGAILSLALVTAKANEGMLLYAIESHDLAEVQMTLDEMLLTVDSKEKFIKATEDASLQAKKVTHNIFRSKYDIARLITGTSLVGVSGLFVLCALDSILEPIRKLKPSQNNDAAGKLNLDKTALSQSIVSVLVGSVGCYQLYTGLTLASAREQLKKARAIESLVKSRAF